MLQKIRALQQALSQQFRALSTRSDPQPRSHVTRVDVICHDHNKNGFRLTRREIPS